MNNNNVRTQIAIECLQEEAPMKDIDELDRLHAADAERIREELRTSGRHYTEPHEYLHNAWPEVSARLRAAEAEVERLRGALRAMVDTYPTAALVTPSRFSNAVDAARAALGEP